MFKETFGENPITDEERLAILLLVGNPPPPFYDAKNANDHARATGNLIGYKRRVMDAMLELGFATEAERTEAHARIGFGYTNFRLDDFIRWARRQAYGSRYT